MPTLTARSGPAAGSRSQDLWLRVVGEGEPLVLLHGLGMHGDAFRFLAPTLAESAQLIVPDLRGHGRSAHVPGPYTAEGMAADLAPMLDSLGIHSAHILGHSHGGAVAQVFAHQHPERARSLVLISSYAVQRITWWQHLIGRILPGVIRSCGTRQMAWVIRQFRSAGGGRRLGAPAAALAASMLAANDPGCLGNALHCSRRFDSRSWLDAIQVPTLVIAGDVDCVIVPAQAKELASGIPGAHLALLPGAGHAVPLSHPAEVAALITSWIRRAENDVTAAAHAHGLLDR